MMSYVIIKQIHLLSKIEDSYHDARSFHSDWTNMISKT